LPPQRRRRADWSRAGRAPDRTHDPCRRR